MTSRSPIHCPKKAPQCELCGFAGDGCSVMNCASDIVGPVSCGARWKSPGSQPPLFMRPSYSTGITGSPPHTSVRDTRRALPLSDGAPADLRLIYLVAYDWFR